MEDEVVIIEVKPKMLIEPMNQGKSTFRLDYLKEVTFCREKITKK